MQTSAKQVRFTRSGSLERLHAAIHAALPELQRDIKAVAGHHREICDGLVHKNDRDSFSSSYLRCQVSKRFQHGSITAKERQDNAIRSFLVSEAACAMSNVRLCEVLSKPIDDRIRSLLLTARHRVRQVLGPLDLESLPRLAAFSSGATTEFTKSRAFLQNKWDQGSHVTARALPYCLAFVAWASNCCISGGWARTFQVVEGNEVFTVVKNYEKDRLAAKEPTWNVFLQKGLGVMLKHRLQARGLLHKDASEKHANLAQLASRLGHLATIDLSAASDSVSLALCELLLPSDWLQVILDLRSPVGILPTGQTIVYEKVSSMGNGYTFELETLIFEAIARAVCGLDAEVTVYGDDIIVPTEHAAEVISLLRFCGFETNEDKTFTAGFFRESCGGHYFNGYDVKPFYIEELPKHTAEVIELHNQILAYSARCPLGDEWEQVLGECRCVVPRSFWGPFGLPGALWSAWDDACPTVSRPRKGPRHDAQHPPSWRVKTFERRVPSQVHDYLDGALSLALRGETNPPAVPRTWGRGSVRSYALACASLDKSREESASSINFPRWARWHVRERYISLYGQWTSPPVRARKVRGADVT